MHVLLLCNVAVFTEDNWCIICHDHNDNVYCWFFSNTVLVLGLSVFAWSLPRLFLSSSVCVCVCAYVMVIFFLLLFTGAQRKATDENWKSAGKVVI